MYKLETRPLHGVAKGKVTIVDMRERTHRDIWDTRAQTESSTLNVPADWAWPGEEREEEEETSRRRAWPR